MGVERPSFFAIENFLKEKCFKNDKTPIATLEIAKGALSSL